MGLATAPTISFQRMRVANEIDSASLLVASIFLDTLNVFQFFLSLFGRSRNWRLRPSYGPRVEPEHRKEEPMMTNVNDNVAAPASTTVRIPDALTALAAGTHGKLTLLPGDDR
jgi:hypothetical protein